MSFFASGLAADFHVAQRIDMKKQLNQKVIDLLGLEPDKAYEILDFGCGSGLLLKDIKNNVSSDSKLVGIDSDEKTIEKVRRSYSGIEFIYNKFNDFFNFPNESFDVIISVDTLECIQNKPALINELHRILKKEGQILFAHWDWDTQVYNSEYKNLIRKFVAAFSDWQQDWMDASDGQMGRKLWGIFQGSGLFNGQMDIFSLLETDYSEGQYGYDRLKDLYSLVVKEKLDKDEYKIILDEMANLKETGEYFYSLNSYIYFGKKA
ncbi:MAG: methyltransferase domain-containing protein [Candidatus Zhuqueibacterota bacterium]